MQNQPNTLIKVAINDVAVGMFVTAIQNNKKLDLENPGRLQNPKALERMIASGVKFVWVDKNRSVKGIEIKAAVEEPTVEEAPVEIKPTSQPQEPLKNKKTKPLNRELSQAKAKKLITEAKGLVNKMLHQTLETPASILTDIASWTDDMIDSVLYAPDALQCMAALRQKDTYLLEHSINVSILLVTFGQKLDMSRKELNAMAIGGLIHDIGKIKVKDSVLNKPGKLTDEEFEHIKLHQTFAYELIDEIEGLDSISRDICLMHHEKLDGKGYPKGLKGEEITLYGRISSIVDIYDALTADRVYKQGMSSSEAFKIMLKLTPFHLDSNLVYTFINCIGIYPVGSLVELSDGRVGIVWTANDTQPLKPLVKCFYSNKHHRYSDVVFEDLSHDRCTIAKAISPNSLSFDVAPFYE
jgi:HD-GYP domain-containing protein (c-di-GMP phosphodiesterase class II)